MTDPVTISAILGLGKAAIEKFFPDPQKRAEATLKLEELAQQGKLAELQAEVNLLLGQIEVNKIEASSTSLFKSGWRPFTGWVCAISLAYAGFFEPMLRFVASVGFDYAGEYPVIDPSVTIPVLLGMLGLAGFRMGEKFKGVASS